MARQFRYSLATLLLVICLCSIGSADNKLPKVNRRVVRECSNILINMRDTKYDHKTHVDADKGNYHLDCSGFLCYFLERFSPEALKVVPIESRFQRQRAVTFHTAFSSESAKTKPFWKSIRQMKDALPGDFFAWRLVTIPRKGNSGHCGVIWSRPVREPDGTYRVRILDSTTTGHQGDRRIDPKVSGLALGTMWFVVNEKGEPVGYHWADRSARPTMRPVAIGRLIRMTSIGPVDRDGPKAPGPGY